MLQPLESGRTSTGTAGGSHFERPNIAWRTAQPRPSGELRESRGYLGNNEERIDIAKRTALGWLGVVLLACLLGTLALAALRWKTTLSYVGASIVASGRPVHADLILVLGGDFWGPRVLKAADLARLGYAPKVLISGPRYRGRPEGELAIEYLAGQRYATNSFESFEHHAHSTLDETLALRPELIRRRVKRVILVTSAYHSRRALILFQLVCRGIDFISVPAPDPYFHPDRWWSDENSRWLFVSEWSKTAGSVFMALGQGGQWIW
jgi:uncharacterized SAM-binding protein YcdF (DUF218 family)